MKFWLKMTLAVTVLLAVSLSVGGYMLVQQNFTAALDNAAVQHSNSHMLERYALENDLLALFAQGDEVTNEHLKRYGEALSGYMGEGRRLFALYDENGIEIYSSLPAGLTEADRVTALQDSKQSYFLRNAGKDSYMLIASRVSAPGRDLQLLNAYPATRLFADRQRQLDDLLRMEVIVLVCAMLLVVLLSKGLTRAIRRMSIQSRKIAAGAYNARTKVSSNDEIGDLSRNFDKMAEAVEEKVDQLNTSLHQRDDFVSAFTHEIKTPMTSIIGYSDILRSMECEPEVRQKAANYIFHESKRLEVLSQKLLALMGMSEHTPLQPVSLNSIFSPIARSVAPALGELRLEIRSAEDVIVMADRELAGDMLRNLILNAIKAEPADGCIRVNWEKCSGGRVRVIVFDTGRGIPPEEVERITEPFYMVDKSRARQEGGSGIGLALCSKIAALHGGGLSIKSKLGEGTAVGFTLALYEKKTKEGAE